MAVNETQITMQEALGGLRALRARRGLSLDDLAGETGIDRSEWSRIERGKRPLSAKAEEALASTYGLPVTQIRELALVLPASPSPEVPS